MVSCYVVAVGSLYTEKKRELSRAYYKVLKRERIDFYEKKIEQEITKGKYIDKRERERKVEDERGDIEGERDERMT